MKTDKLDKSDAVKKSRTLRPSLPVEVGRQLGRFPERLKSIAPDGERREFARKLGISEGALRSYLNGVSKPDIDRLVAIAIAGNVNLLWLATGEGEKYPTATGATQAGSGYYAGHGVDEAVLTRALEAVDEALALASREVGIERKAGMVARVYAALARPGSAADHAEVMRLIRSLL